MPRFLKTIEEVNSHRPTDSRWTAIEFTPSVKIGKTIFRKILCRCNCGNEKIVSLATFLSGKSSSCGCLHRDRVRKFSHYIPQLADCWKHMIERCYEPKSERYSSYGAKGVVVCDEWKNSYQIFLDWALANGWQKHLRLDKDFLYIKKHGTKMGMIYSPEYCQFITHKQNIDRTSRSIYFEYNGEMKTINELLPLSGLKRDALARRLSMGMSAYDAVHTPFGINKGIGRVKKAKKYDYKGELLTLREIGGRYGIPYNTLWGRLNGGNSIDKAIEMGKPDKRFLNKKV